MKAAPQNYSLLLVDDSEIVSRRVAALISDYCDCCDIYFAKSSREAYQNLNDREFDFVIADIQLEGKKRFDMIKFIKKLKKTPKLVVLTNQVSEQHKNICLALGADFFVDKSVDFEQLPLILSGEKVIVM